jgi:hypothetical protein
VSQQINLYNPAFLKLKKSFSAGPMAQALLVLLVGALATSAYASWQVRELEKRALVSTRQLEKLKETEAAAIAQLHPREKSKDLAADIAAAEAELRALQHVSDVLKRGEFGNTQGYSEYFKAVARQNVQGMWLTGLSITNPGPEIVVQGRAMQAALVPNFIARLTNEPIMKGKVFDSLNISQPMVPVKNPKEGEEGMTAAPYVDFGLQSTLAKETTAPPEGK